MGGGYISVVLCNANIQRRSEMVGRRDSFGRRGIIYWGEGWGFEYRLSHVANAYMFYRRSMERPISTCLSVDPADLSKERELAYWHLCISLCLSFSSLLLLSPALSGVLSPRSITCSRLYGDTVSWVSDLSAPSLLSQRRDGRCNANWGLIQFSQYSKTFWQ